MKDWLKRGDRWYLAAAFLMLAGTAVLQLAARCLAGFATWYAHRVYPVLVGTIGRLSGIFPFSVAEMCGYLLVGYLTIEVIALWSKNKKPVREGGNFGAQVRGETVCKEGRGRGHRGQQKGTHPCVELRAVTENDRPWKILVLRILFLCSLLLFLYTANCGVNYYAAPFSSYAGIETGKYTKAELRELCEYLLEEVNALADEGAAEQCYRDHRAEWRREGVTAMQSAAAAESADGENGFACLGGYYPPPKELTVSWLLSVQQLCGIYLPFTIEANFNGDMPDYNIPHTICHELSHLKGFMREDEANFIGYLACISSDDPAFRYSGYLTGWVYAGNALARADWDAYSELRRKLDARAESDLRENNAFWDSFEGTVAEVSNQMNDVYLKANSQEDGVKSYGRMVDLMLAYYKDKK